MLIPVKAALPHLYTKGCVPQKYVSPGSYLVKSKEFPTDLLYANFRQSPAMWGSLPNDVPLQVVCRTAGGEPPVSGNSHLWLQKPNGGLVELDAFYATTTDDLPVYSGLEFVSNPWALVDEVIEGTALIADDGFDCMVNGQVYIVRNGPKGLYVECDEESHLLDGQREGLPNIEGSASYYIGLKLRDKVVGYYCDENAIISEHLPAYANSYGTDPYTIVSGEIWTIDRDGDLLNPLGPLPPLGTKISPDPVTSRVVGTVAPVFGPMMSILVADLMSAGPRNPGQSFPFDMFKQMHALAWTRLGHNQKNRDAHFDNLCKRLRENKLTMDDLDFIFLHAASMKLEAILLHMRTPTGEEAIAVASDEAVVNFADPNNKIRQGVDTLRASNPQRFDDWVKEFIDTLTSLGVGGNDPGTMIASGQAALIMQRDAEIAAGASHGPLDFPNARASAVARRIADELANSMALRQ